MKKLIITTIFVVACVFSQAQNFDILYVQSIASGQEYHYCSDEYDGVIVYGRQECQSQNEWEVNDEWSYNDSIVLYKEVGYFGVYHNDCIDSRLFYVTFHSSDIPNPFPEPYIWKRQGETITLSAGNLYGYGLEWSTGETTHDIEVLQDGLYTLTVINELPNGHICSTETFPIEVRDNVEIVSASVDPGTNKNLVTWNVTPEQATYISNVIVNRDGVDMATVPYTDGQFLDNIGSDLAARIYTIVGVCPDGTLCPIQSLSRGTIHMAFLPDINGNVEMTWNQPELGGADIHVGRFEICEYDPDSNEINVIDFVSSVTTSYSCNQSMFDYGYPLIRAIIQDGRGERDMLSNRTEDLVGLNETATGMLRVYPNPSNGVFNIEGSGILHIVNVLGQEIMAKEIDGKETVELPKGMYFVQLNGMTRKIVVE